MIAEAEEWASKRRAADAPTAAKKPYSGGHSASPTDGQPARKPVDSG